MPKVRVRHAVLAVRLVPRLARLIGLGILWASVVVLVVLRWGFGLQWLVAAPAAAGTAAVLTAGVLWLAARLARTLESVANVLRRGGNAGYEMSPDDLTPGNAPANPEVIDGIVVSRDEPPEIWS